MKRFEQPILVTRPYLPELDEFKQGLEEVWANIVPVHVYGHPCDVEGFARLGEKYGVKIIYDAAHAFGVKLNGRSIAACGDMAMFSFHPTKLFHSCEGGFSFSKIPRFRRRLNA